MFGRGSSERLIAIAMAWAAAIASARGAAPAVPAAPAGPGAAPREIALAQRIDAELKPGESHRYQMTLAAGRAALAVATQTGIDVALVLRGPGGAEIAREDARSSGMEPLVGIAPVTGSYEILVSGSPRSTPGRYTLVVSDMTLDPDRGAALQHHAAGRRLASGAREGWPESRGEFIAARASWDAAREPAMAAYSSQELGLLSLALQDLTAAKDAFTDAARRFDDLGLTPDLAVALKSQGEALMAAGEFRAASDALRTVLSMEPSLTPVDRVTLHYDIGCTAKELGDYDASLTALRVAIAAFHDLGMVPSELTARSEMASVHVMRSDPVRALEELTAGVVLSREAARPDQEARFHQRLGVVYWEAGDEDAGAEEWGRALTLHRAAGNRIGEAAVLMSLGDYDSMQGKTGDAIAKYQKAYDILTELGSKQGQARALTRLGTALAKRGELARAEELQTKAVEINQAIGNKQGEALALKNLAATKSSLGDRAAARDVLTRALALSRELGGGIARPDIIADLALVYRDLGDTDRALGLLDESLAEFEAEQRRALVPSLQAGIGHDAQSAYAARIDILMSRHLVSPRAGWDAKALETAERARARALLGMLAESHVDIRKGVEPALLARYRSLQAEAASASAAAKADTGRLSDLTSRLHLAEAEIRRASPGYAALTQPQPLDLAAIRGRVLDRDTVLLEYALGEKRSWLWAVTKDEIVSAALPPRDEIEAAARRLYQDLGVRPSVDGARRTEEDAAAVGRALLTPIAARLEGPWKGKRLVIVPVGALDYVPFGALPAPSRAGAEGSPAQRLIEVHEVVTLPSASVVERLRRERAGRRAAPRRIALFGDPVFGSDDPRVRRDGDAGALSRASGTRSGEESDPESNSESDPMPDPSESDPGSRAALVAAGAKGFARLPFSREEVRSIASLLGEQDVLLAVDFRASRALGTSAALGGYQMLHFATHGLLDTAHPELSGLVLSQVDESGRPVDGFLRLQDIYNMHLGADLVVLSACRTALGRQIAGEGLVGLTRGFMYAGSPRVVASLWQVDDSATSVLMTAFYSGMLKDKLRPAAALRAAQLRIAADPRWKAPFYWAGFTLQGDWQ